MGKSKNSNVIKSIRFPEDLDSQIKEKPKNNIHIMVLL